MQTAIYDYLLPPELIAHTPLLRRDQSRLLSVSLSKKTLSHGVFSDITTLLGPQDVLILNDTKVIKARLFAHKSTGGKVELFVLSPLSYSRWQVLITPSKRIRLGETLKIAEGFFATPIQKMETGFEVEFTSELSFYEALEAWGEVPLPPYIHPGSESANAYRERYQTIVAQHEGAIAAPTAGLHFTQDLLTALRSKGVHIETVTLHVGYGTFRPIQTETLDEHMMHSERYSIAVDTAQRLNEAKKSGKRLIAVGTTVTRALETASHEGEIHAGEGKSNLFIRPGYSFKSIDGLITNFHLPKSTLLVLVSTFAGKPLVDRAYQAAIAERYRFYSFGDAMVMLP